MNLIKTKLDGLVVLKPTIIKDSRGYFIQSYNKKNINKLLGSVNFVQDNESKSFKGVIRGLHFQKPPHAQSKLVRCLEGEILHVALDLRNNSRTYGMYETTLLTATNKNQLFIPKGFAHGFQVLSNEAIVNYKVDEHYNSDSDSGIIWNDKDLSIDWNLDIKPILSDKDLKLDLFKNLKSPF